MSTTDSKTTKAKTTKAATTKKAATAKETKEIKTVTAVAEVAEEVTTTKAKAEPAKEVSKTKAATCDSITIIDEDFGTKKVTIDEIRAKAHAIWAANGYRQGFHEEDWAEAERVLTAAK